jgi:hypothetical protein
MEKISRMEMDQTKNIFAFFAFAIFKGMLAAKRTLYLIDLESLLYVPVLQTLSVVLGGTSCAG